MQFLIAHIGHTCKSNEHITWWNPDCAGYTICTAKAGRYSEDKAKEISRYGHSMAVPLPVAEALTRGVPKYRKHDGTLANMYDGSLHKPVENTPENWKQLIAGRLDCGVVPHKPTPMPRSKSRAIYLDTVQPVPTHSPDAGDEKQPTEDGK